MKIFTQSKTKQKKKQISVVEFEIDKPKQIVKNSKHATHKRTEPKAR